MGNTPSSPSTSPPRFKFDPLLDSKGPGDDAKSVTKTEPENPQKVPSDPPPPYSTEAGEMGSNTMPSDQALIVIALSQRLQCRLLEAQALLITMQMSVCAFFVCSYHTLDLT